MSTDFMAEALRLALAGMGRTSPNPSVGAVIARDGNIVATGSTREYGGDHAEVSAIKAAGGNLRGAEIFVSLEPCCHHGKTPPCTEAIIAAGISRVHIPLLDPNPLVAGKGVQALRDAGVEVVLRGDMAPGAADIIRPFKKYILRKRPFTVLKMALTLDGRTATAGGDSKWISNDWSRLVAHRLRSLCDAVIVGSNTLAVDNPSLTVRFGDFPHEVHESFRLDEFRVEGYDNYLLRALTGPGEGVFAPREPLRVAYGLPDNPDRGWNFFRTDNYLVLERVARRAALLDGGPAARWLRDAHDAGRLVFLPAGSPEETIAAGQEVMARRGVMFAMLEGGSTLAGSFLDAGEIDQFIFCIAPLVAGAGRPSLAGRGADKIRDALELKDMSSAWLKGDLLYGGYRASYNFESM
ncbi:MAG TPA: bifunctional diaminohydroxyphosphoribosylaminopyrimidine deaminase/5-amino-6-(5-phosphoribosylamino)uracil reductase RibD [Spirochaetota bacterium]|nr:bifunctional diaminohydroxyphosphoribosylaminopyrimidine deaminase/5-amino-6-(5-phosphoribosylamino)uracil reductase RibD [Spirochaetota bacterium]